MKALAEIKEKEEFYVVLPVYAGVPEEPQIFTDKELALKVVKAMKEQDGYYEGDDVIALFEKVTPNSKEWV